MTTALICVDVQNDFTTGSLAVPGGEGVAVNIADHLEFLKKINTEFSYDYVLASKDFHHNPGSHWSNNPDFKDSWPVHCAVGTFGAELQDPLKDDDFDAIFLKGWDTAAYSAFEGTSAADAHYGLHEYLQDREVTRLFVGGIATDYCVKATVLDALRLGYEVVVIKNLIAAVNPETGAAAIEEMRAAGAKIV